MTTDVWKDKSLSEVCSLLGLSRRADIARALKKNRKTVDRLLNYQHEQEPLTLLDELARVLDKRARSLGLAVRLCDVRAAWRVGSKECP